MNKIVAFVGMAGSGKSIGTDYLESRGFTKIYFGGVTYDKMREDGIEITLESETAYREGLRKKYGMGAYAILLLDKIKESFKQGNTVLDGLYSWDELKVLQEEFGDTLKVIAVIADKKLRYERFNSRVERAYMANQVESRDINEIEKLAKGGPIAFADYYIYNNGSIEDYIIRLNEIIDSI